MTRGTALVANIAAVVQLTGVNDLALLESGGELTVTDLLTTASDAIYDQIEADGIDPTTLSNQTIYERAVAWHFLAILVQMGYVAVPAGLDIPANAYEWSDPYYARVRPKVSGDDAGRIASEGIPAVGNFEHGWEYVQGNNATDQYYDDLPGVL
jgi:hypothetical protein